jgi:hypothetical protein
VDHLDQLDGRRHDAKAVVGAANDFSRLSGAEQEEHLGLWGYAGMDDAQHPFTGLLRESHNGTCVVRDLDGTLQFLWQESAAFDRWSIGPLYRENLIDDSDLEELLDADPDWLSDQGISLSPPELIALMAALPSAPGPVMRF